MLVHNTVGALDLGQVELKAVLKSLHFKAFFSLSSANKPHTITTYKATAQYTNIAKNLEVEML